MLHIGAGGGFVKANAHPAGTFTRKAAQVHALRHRLLVQGFGRFGAAHIHHHGVKRGVPLRGTAQRGQAFGQDGGVAGHALRNALEALRAVVHGVHAGHHSGQYLCGADVGSGFFAANVLLARLQRQPVGRVAVAVDTHTHQAAG